MRNRSVLVVATVVVLLSAFIAHAAVYWTPWFGARADYGIGGLFRSGGIYPDPISYSYDYFVPDITDLTKLQPEEFQEVIQRLFDDLMHLSEAQLYMLNSVDEVCLSKLIVCQGIPSKTVKPFLEKALAHKQARESLAISAGSLDTARLSLVVAFAAFIVSIAGLFVKRKA
jgi:hypothetical protein